MDTQEAQESLTNRPSDVAACESPLLVTFRGPRNGQPDPRLRQWTAPPGWKRDMWISGSGLFPSVRPGLVLRELSEHLVIEDPLTRDKHALNSAAASLFLLCNGRRNAEDVAEFFALTFGEKKTSVEDKVRQVLQELVQKKVLVLRTLTAR